MRSALFFAAAAGAAFNVEARRVHHRSSSVPAVNTRPIIGILSMPTDYPGYENKSYFPASYVKWLESAGARVVPLLYTSSAAEIQQQLQYLNGALFTGGGTDFTNPDGSLSQFAKTGLIIFNESVQAWSRGEVFPLWGTCQGHELVSFLGSNMNMSTLTGGFDSENLTIPLNFTNAAATSRLYGSMPANVLSIFANEPVTMNNHQMGVTPEDFAAAPALASRFTVLATNMDRVGKEFVSSMEGRNGLPIFTSQYHPEKPQFEWYIDEVINHSFDSIMANHWPALFFVNQTRANTRAFPNPDMEAAALIYNYEPVYTEALDPGFEQCYFFDA